MKVKGEANTCWATEKQEMDEKGQYRDETQTVTAHEEYFETKYYLVGSASGKARLFIHDANKFYTYKCFKHIYNQLSICLVKDEFNKRNLGNK